MAYTVPCEGHLGSCQEPRKPEKSRYLVRRGHELFHSGVDYLERFDDRHSDDEDRFIAIGPIRRGLVMVVWTERDGDVVRIISARWATRREQALFRSHIRRLT